MESIFWFLFLALIALLTVVAGAALSAIAGGILLFRSRRQASAGSQRTLGAALLAVGFLPFLCVCLASLRSAPLAVQGLSYLPQSVDINSPEVQAMLLARSEAGAEERGFTPIDPTARIEIDRTTADDPNYDVMLHIYGSTSRTVVFRQDGADYKWLGEQETFTGPGQFPTSTGYSNEQISIMYDTVYLSGAPLNQIYILYFGDDQRLLGRQDLTLNDVRPILIEWNAIPGE
jgi:hypothetical protein